MNIFIVTLSFIGCSVAFVAVPRDHVKTGWTTITSDAQLAFAHSGDYLHLKITNASLFDNYISLELFGFKTKLGNGPDALETKLTIPFLKHTFYKNDTDNDWYLGAGKCTHKFSVNPIPDADDTVIWAFHMSQVYTRVIVNNEWVLNVKKYHMLQACFDSDLDNQYFGAIQINNLKGYQYRSESVDELKEMDYCLVPNNRAMGQIIGSKRAMSYEECANDCKFFDQCMRASYDSCFGTCDFYRNDGTDRVHSSMYSLSLEERYSIATEVECLKVLIDLSCTHYNESPCMRYNTRFLKMSKYRSYTESSVLEINPKQELINVKQCFDETYKSQRFVEWNPTYLSCGSIDLVYQNGPLFDSSGYLVYDRQCEAELVNQTTYEPCFEVGALLKGQVIDEIYDYNYQLDCQDACKSNTICTGWSAIATTRTCYLYTGRVFKESFTRAVSGTYNCNKEFAQVPPPGHFIVKPTGTAFNLVVDDGPKIFNLFLLVNNRRRTINAFDGPQSIFTIDFFLNRQHSEYDLRLKKNDTLSVMYNYTTEPCSREQRTTNIYTIETYYDVNDELSLKMTCGESFKDSFFHEFNLTTNYDLDFQSWDSFKFISFEETDSYNFGDAADPPPRTNVAAENPTTTWLPEMEEIRGSGGHAGHKKKRKLRKSM